jgi:hypothetical protein
MIEEPSILTIEITEKRRALRMEGIDYRGKERREKSLRTVIEKRRQYHNNPLISTYNFSLFIISYLFR